MLRKTLIALVTISVMLGIVLSHEMVMTESLQPPAANTGAPGETTCGQSSCHNFNASVNFQKVSLQFIPVAPNGYSSGGQYTMAVAVVTGFQFNKYGFQITAVDTAGNGIGTFALTSPANTSLTTGGQGRQYVGHKIATNTAQWTFSWTAPNYANYAGPVYFYIAGNQTDGGGTTLGDEVYLAQYTLSTSAFSQGICNPAPLAISSSQGNSFCQGEITTLSVPGSFATYTWSTGSGSATISVASGGTYSVTTVDNNLCSRSGSITLTAVPAPNPSINWPGSNPIVSGSMLSVPGTFSQYLWSNGETTATIAVTADGNYWVDLTTAEGCTGRSDTVSIVVAPIGIVQLPEELISISPNPFKDRFSVTMPNPPTSATIFRVFDLSGKVVVEIQPTTKEFFVEQSLNQGLYLYELQIDSKTLIRGKLLKN